MAQKVRFGIVGTGMIANAIAETLGECSKAECTAVVSRELERAKEFASSHNIANPYDSLDAMLQSDIDAVYAACPTSIMESVCMAAAKAGKHVLADKPFASLASFEAISSSCKENNVLLMDATHFAHHPRTALLKKYLRDDFGSVTHVHTSFLAPIHDKGNIRYDTTLEPMGALGDLGWYCMRAIIEYLQPDIKGAAVSAKITRDDETNAIVHASGLWKFKDGKSATFQCGFQSNVSLMDLQIFGTAGMIRLDDFVLDFNNSFPFDNPEHKTGFTVLSGATLEPEESYIETPSPAPQQLLMIEEFAKLASDYSAKSAAPWAALSGQTQELVDSVFEQSNRKL